MQTPPPDLPPAKILKRERLRGGEQLALVRLSDGRAGWVLLPDGELTDELLREVERAMLSRFVPPPALGG